VHSSDLLFEECIFGSIWALEPLPLDRLDSANASALAPMLQPGNVAHDLLVTTSDRCSISVLQIDSLRRRMVNPNPEP
jgi:hypothetical protein